MGSKARFMKELKPIIEGYITDKTVAYIELFAGVMSYIVFALTTLV